MIKLLCLLLPLTLLNGQNFVFLLPDEKSVFESWLQSRIKKSAHPLFILTPSMHYPTLTKSLIAHQSHGLDFTLIVNALDHDSLSLIQYQNTYLFHYQARLLRGSLIISEPYVCQSSAGLDEERLKTGSATIFCTDDAETLEKTRHIFTLLQKRSSAYLK